MTVEFRGKLIFDTSIAGDKATICWIHVFHQKISRMVCGRAGGRVITITHYTHFKFLLSKFSQIMAKIIIMNVGSDKTFLKFKFSQEIINNGEKCG